jgi:hypothetical protein
MASKRSSHLQARIEELESELDLAREAHGIRERTDRATIQNLADEVKVLEQDLANLRKASASQSAANTRQIADLERQLAAARGANAVKVEELRSVAGQLTSTQLELAAAREQIRLLSEQVAHKSLELAAARRKISDAVIQLEAE